MSHYCFLGPIYGRWNQPRREAPQRLKWLERVQKILAAAGIAPRRASEKLITEGHIHVNGKLVTSWYKADPRRDQITVDFNPIQKEQPVYILMNKPKGYITSVKDDEGRPTVMALIHGVTQRVYPWAAWTSIPKGCCCSPMMVSWRRSS